MHRDFAGQHLYSKAILLTASIMLALALCGCPDDRPAGTTPNVGKTSKTTGSANQYPILWDTRPYKDVHDSADQAWFLTENAYYVVQEKWRNARGEQRKAVEEEIDNNVFGVNSKVDQLFKDAIEQEPDNALNYATYAMWLKPRKYIKDGGFVNAYPDAIKNIDKAIELWPDEARFYLLKAWIITAPNYGGDWLRASVDEKLAVSAALPEIEQLYATAEKYDPDNSYINYAHAITVFRFTDPAELDSIRDTLMREIRAGNRKKTSYFFFPPPLLPYNQDARVAVLWGNEVEPIFYDHWHQFGDYSANAVRAMVDSLAQGLDWPEDKQDFAELMYFCYGVGRTQPYDRSYFSMQQRLMDIIMEKAKDNSAEMRKLAEQARFLASQYKSAAQEFYDKKILEDVKRIDVSGVEKVEQSGSRKLNQKDALQRREAAFLKSFGEAFGLEIPLPKNSEDW